ncbi:MAG TPA: SRPBCC family protein [Planctomycetota bacterium]|nr:SRPBCC family protein [Planctomycetota bacterium]
MTHVENAVQVEVPLRTAYDQWTQFEEFPRFMEGVESVEQLDPAHVAWNARIAGQRVGWTAEIVEQRPDQVIAWRSTSGAKHEGRLTFEPMSPTRTRLRVALDYEPQGLSQKTADAIGLVALRIGRELESFKSFIESRRAPTGGWRGRITDGIVESVESEETSPRDLPPSGLY